MSAKDEPPLTSAYESLSIEELARLKGVKPVTSLADMAGDKVSRTWGRTVAAAQRRGRVPPVNDSWIAAACLAHGLPLATSTPRTSSTSLITKA